ncbi:MAG: hypothetical protein ACREPM_12835 [Gemmatimonadaceae bacterium]
MPRSTRAAYSSLSFPAHAQQPARTIRISCVVPALLACAFYAAPAQRPLFTFQEVMIPVRDGIRLQTVIMTPTPTPTNQSGPLPILLRRTPLPVNLEELAHDG